MLAFDYPCDVPSIGHLFYLSAGGWAREGVYVNRLGQDEGARTPTNNKRLRALKRRADPGRLFRSTHNVLVAI